jgi:hypothetical protein
MDFRGTTGRPFDEVWVRFEGLPDHASYETVDRFIETLRADPAVQFPATSSLVDLLRPTSSSQRGMHAVLRLVRPNELEEEDWIAQLLEALRRLKLASLPCIPQGPSASLTPIEPVLLTPPSHPPSTTASSILQLLPLNTPIHFDVLLPQESNHSKTRPHPKRRRTQTSCTPHDQIHLATQTLAELKTRETDFLAAKSLLDERSNRISPLQKFVKNIRLNSSSNLSS